jgi:hypothetical protein
LLIIAVDNELARSILLEFIDRVVLTPIAPGLTDLDGVS